MKLIFKNPETITEQNMELVKKCLPKRFARCEYTQNINTRLETLTSSFLIIDEFGEDISSSLTENEYKKPYIPGKHFNVSHDKGLVVLAVDDEEIGVDLALNKKYNINVLKRSLTLNEQLLVESNENLFIKIWAMKESVSKLFGLGLSMGFNTFDVSPFFNNEEVNLLKNSVFNYTFEYNNYVVSISSFKTINPKSIEIITK